MSFIFLPKRCIHYTVYLSIILKASFSEGFLALQNKECLHCSAKQPASISHECWIMLGVPRCILRMRVWWFYNDSNMVKRYSVKPIANSFHRHGSSVLLNAINENCSRCLWLSTLQLPASKRIVPWISFVEVGVAISFLFFPQNSQYRESQRGADEACLAETAVRPNNLSLFHALMYYCFV